MRKLSHTSLDAKEAGHSVMVHAALIGLLGKYHSCLGGSKAGRSESAASGTISTRAHI